MDSTKYELESMDKPANDYRRSWRLPSEWHSKLSKSSISKWACNGLQMFDYEPNKSKFLTSKLLFTPSSCCSVLSALFSFQFCCFCTCALCISQTYTVGDKRKSKCSQKCTPEWSCRLSKEDVLSFHFCINWKGY